jgi:outer membrane immunogenic protein
MRRHGQPAAVLVGLSFSESAKAANFAVYAAASDSRAPMLFKAPMLAAWTWAGPYLGGTIGYSAGKSRTDTIFGDPASGAGLFATTASRDLDGAIGGAQAGYNWLAGMWLAGIEGDLNYSGQRAKLNAVCPGDICNPGLIGIVNDPSVIAQFEQGQKFEWFATLRARLAVTVTPDAIAYVTGGLAVGEVMTAGTVFGFDGFGNPVNTIVGSHNTKAGWTLGGGLEGRLAGNWTAKIEYLYLAILGRSRPSQRRRRIRRPRWPSIPASPTVSCASASTTNSIQMKSGPITDRIAI